MKRAIVLAFVLVVACGATAAALAKPSAKASASATQAISCKSTLKIAFVTPLTGVAAFLGQEQLLWAKYAVKTLPPTLGLKIQLLTGDTPVEQGPAPAQALAQKYVADSRVVGILGPSTSGAVRASSQTYFDAGLAHVSGSASNTDLTYGEGGKPKSATPAFFRVIPGDNIQGPTDARFMIQKLKVKKVVLFDFQEPYSVGFADIVQAYLKKAGVSTIRFSVSNLVTDFSSFVTKVPNDTDIVFFPTQAPPAAQNFGQQLIEQGKKAKMFGGDGTNNPAQFKVPGSYVSNFAAPIDLFPYNKTIVAGWKKDNPGAALGSFGPPTYAAMQVLLSGIKRTCDQGKGQIKNRRDIIRNVKRVRLHNWILGGDFRFSTKTNDPLNGHYTIFQIQSNGTYKLIQ